MDLVSLTIAYCSVLTALVSFFEPLEFHTISYVGKIPFSLMVQRKTESAFLLVKPGPFTHT